MRATGRAHTGAGGAWAARSRAGNAQGLVASSDGRLVCASFLPGHCRACRPGGPLAGGAASCPRR
eukprot:3801540-Alexandrium_andersonii.AAC.1